jgi:hypothetical protein
MDNFGRDLERLFWLIGAAGVLSGVVGVWGIAKLLEHLRWR